MRVPLSWLRDFAPFDGDAGGPRRHPRRPRAGGRGDRAGRRGPGRHGGGPGRRASTAIEGADRIRRVVVDDGTGPVEVVCGAWNFAVGDLVALAPVGAVLPGGFAIGTRKMKGVVSNGMLCSGRELRLSDDHEGILLLNDVRGRGRGPAPGRGARHRARRGLRHRRRGQPTRRLVHGRGGPGPGRPARTALRHPRPPAAEPGRPTDGAVRPASTDRWPPSGSTTSSSAPGSPAGSSPG